MLTKRLTPLCKTLFLTPLFLLIYHFSWAQACSGASGQDVHLTGLEEFTAEGSAGDSGLAEDIYKQSLVAAAVDQGLASCPTDSCVQGKCKPKFGDYEDGSRTPNSSTNGAGDFVFEEPSNGDQKFSVDCGCSGGRTSVQIEIYPPYEGGGRTIDGEHDHSLHLAPSEIKFFPNPAQDQITLALHMENEAAPMVVQIHNLQGQLVSSRQLGRLEKGQHQFHLEIQNLPAGIYLASVQTDEEIIARSRVVIQR